MKLYFVRHGESEANVRQEFSNGLGKHPLTEKGRQQARDLAGRLQGEAFTACYTSPILRAAQTAEILSAALGIACQSTDALREFDVGILEGRSDEASWQLHGQLWGAWMAGRDWDQRIEGGESHYDIQRRFVPFIEGLVQQYQDTPARLLLVSHGGTLRSMLPLVLRNLDFDFVAQNSLPNTGVICAESAPQGLVCTGWADIDMPPVET